MSAWISSILLFVHDLPQLGHVSADLPNGPPQSSQVEVAIGKTLSFHDFMSMTKDWGVGLLPREIHALVFRRLLAKLIKG